MSTVTVAVDRHRRDPARAALRGLGQLLVTAGVVILLFIAYELWWTGIFTRHEQHKLLNTLQRQWESPAAGQPLNDPPLGSGIAILRIPRLGKNYKFVIVQGTSTADLEKGPGHYVGTAMPGRLGNFYVAGHRTTYLHPFYNINQLRSGDPIVLETRDRWFTYTVENIPGTTAKAKEIVSPSDFAVTYPVPDQSDPGKPPTQKVLTFSSCNPRYSAAQRIIIHALLTQSQPKTQGLPPALTAEGLT